MSCNEQFSVQSKPYCDQYGIQLVHNARISCSPAVQLSFPPLSFPPLSYRFLCEREIMCQFYMCVYVNDWQLNVLRVP